MFKKLCLAAALALIAPSVNAQMLAAELGMLCGSRDPLAAQECIGHVSGTYDGIWTGFLLANQDVPTHEMRALFEATTQVCVPGILPTLQIGTQARLLVEADPSLANVPATIVILQALQDTFPCRAH